LPLRSNIAILNQSYGLRDCHRAGGSRSATNEEQDVLQVQH